MKPTKPHVAEYKKKEVARIAKLIQDNPIFGIINMENLPSAQLQKMRSQLKSKALIFMTKRRLIKIAVEELKGKIKGIENVEPYLKGIPALIFTKENPFKLYKTLEKSKTNTGAKPGQVSPKDIVIPAGPTSFTPGPIIGELGQLGIKSFVDAGKIVIKEDKLLLKEGEVINQKAAEMLQKMGIEPMEIGLNLLMVFENGLIFAKSVLAVDEKTCYNDIKKIASESMNLALNAKYFVKETIELLLKKAFIEADSVAEKGDILTEERVKYKLSHAKHAMESVKASLNLPGKE